MGLYAYNVYLNGKNIDTIFYNTKQDVEDVKRSLVNHDGYDPNITVRPESSKKNLKRPDPEYDTRNAHVVLKQKGNK